MIRFASIVLAAALLVVATPHTIRAAAKTSKPAQKGSTKMKSGHVEVNGINYYSDMIQLDHAIAFYHLLGGGLKDAGWQREHMSQNRLAILPDLTHYEMFTTDRLAATVLPFLDGKSGAPSWAEQVNKK